MRRGRGGGTTARRDGMRVFRQFVWLEVGYAKVTLPLGGLQSRAWAHFATMPKSVETGGCDDE